MNLIARYRCGNEVRGRPHWREKIDRRCRICKEEEGTIWHVIKSYEATRGGLGVKVLRGAREGLEERKRIQR